MNNLNSKNFFTTSKLYEEITKNVFAKSGIDPYKRRYNYLYITHKIIWDSTIKKGDTAGAKMNIETLSKLFGKSKQETSSILKDLEDWGIIYESEKYTYKQSSSRYALTDAYSKDKFTVMQVDITDVSFIKKLIDVDKVESDRILKQLKINIKNITVNELGLEYLNCKYSNIKKSFSSINLNTIEGGVSKETVFKVSKTAIFGGKEPKFFLGGVEIDQMDLPLISIFLGDYNTSRPDPKSRVYNNLTNLKRELRNYVSFNGKPLMMTDISNCQPLLSVAFVKKEFRIISGFGESGLHDDIKHYQELTESGMFYEYLLEKSGYMGDRGKFKKDFFAQVFFSKVVKYSMPIKDVFIQEFPNVYMLINRLKRENFKNFSIGLQRMEAGIMIDTVAKKMIKQGKCVLTLHDAIVCDNETDLELAEKLISDAMAKHYITPKFKRESAQLILSNMDDIHVEDVSGSERSVIIADEKLIQHSFGEVLIQNYNDFKTATATLTGDDMRTLINRFAVSAVGYNGATINNIIYSFIVKYEDIEGKEDEMKVIVFKEKIIRKLVA
ncbi:hypothetical protein [Pedobacter sp. FW305-3-2-15-E-R2A2]|uniref:hypothetical protein n=1 Tax=Pedobacter sp. FW305-3-2-15-E-R2A2 TaxID=3140251 RepID=UPI003140B272